MKERIHQRRDAIIYHAIILISLLSAHLLTAQTPTITISGIITDSTSGEALVGATVTITDGKSSSARRGAITNKFGFYSLQNIAPGSYQLSASSIGYTSRTIPITVLSGEQSRKLNIQLGSRPIESGQVIVEGKSDKGISPSIGRIDLRPEFLKRLPSLGGEVDIFRAIQLLPGVKASSELSSGLYVRGGSADETLILLDGVTVYNPSHLGGFMSTFNADAIKDIRLIKGSIPAEYGGRLSSVLDLTMREGTKEKFSGTAGISLINSRLTLEGPINENSTFMVSGRRMYLDLFTALLGDSTIPTYYFYDVNAKANYKLSDNDRIYLSGYFGRDVLDYTSGSDGFRIDWGNATGNFRWAHILSPSVFSNFSAIATTYSFGSRVGGTDEATKQQGSFATSTNIRDLT
ncbi:MAG: TonB-dependent receptor, partial [Candidatus Kapaibacterium sp.]